MLAEKIGEHPEVTLTYFQPDQRKSGGAYVTVTGRVKKLDHHLGMLVLEAGQTVPIEDLIEVWLS